MNKRYNITDKSGKVMKSGLFSEPEVRMAAKAGFRVFEINNRDGETNKEITPGLTGLFDTTQNEFKN